MTREKYPAERPNERVINVHGVEVRLRQSRDGDPSHYEIFFPQIPHGANGQGVDGQMIRIPDFFEYHEALEVLQNAAYLLGELDPGMDPIEAAMAVRKGAEKRVEQLSDFFLFPHQQESRLKDAQGIWRM